MRLRRKPTPEPTAHIWNLDTVLRNIHQEGATMQQKVRSTDDPFVPLTQRPRMITSPEEARNAPLGQTAWCGFCHREIPPHGPSTHKCVDAAGRDLSPLKRAAVAGARRELEALKRFPIPPCEICGLDGQTPGSSHICNLSTKPMPHEIADRRAGGSAKAPQPS